MYGATGRNQGNLDLLVKKIDWLLSNVLFFGKWSEMPEKQQLI